MVLRSASTAATVALGRRLGQLLRPDDVIALSGELGTGKTVLTRGIAEGAGTSGYMASPTFTFIREYGGIVPISHVDLYRVDDPRQLEDLGLEEVFSQHAVVVIEWAEKAIAYLPSEHLWIALRFLDGDDERELEFLPRGPRYERLTAALSGETFVS